MSINMQSSTIPLDRPPTSAPSMHETVEVHIRARTIMKVLALVLIFYAGTLLAVAMAPILLTIVIAAFFAVAADPLIRMMEGKGLGRTPAVLLFLAGLLVILSVLIAVFVPPLVDQADKLVGQSDTFVEEFRKNDTIRNADEKFGLVEKASNELASLPGKVSSEIAGAVGVVFAGLFTVFTIIFLMVLMLIGGGTVVNGIAQLYPKIAERRWWAVVQDAYRSIGAYVGGTLMVASVAGLVLLVTLLILGLPFALPLALWMTLMAVIPLVGATIGAVPAVLVAFFSVDGGLAKGLIMVAVVFVYQQVENSVIQPTILGRVVSLPPLIIFLAVLTGAQLQGVIGALLAVPLAGIIQIVVREALLSGTDTQVDLPPIAPDEVPKPPDGDTADDEADGGDDNTESIYEARKATEAEARAAGDLSTGITKLSDDSNDPDDLEDPEDPEDPEDSDEPDSK